MAKKVNNSKESLEDSEKVVSENETTPEITEVTVVKSIPKEVTPSKEVEPNQEVLNTPRPKTGMSLKDSWKHPSKFKN